MIIPNFIMRLLCNDLISTLLLSRVMMLPRDMIKKTLYNEEENTSLDDLIYDINNSRWRLDQSSNHSMTLLSQHEHYNSIEKILYEDWELITTHDLRILREITVYSFTIFRGRRCRIECNVNMFLCGGSQIDVNARISSLDSEHITIELDESSFIVLYRTNNDPPLYYITTENRSIQQFVD